MNRVHAIYYKSRPTRKKNKYTFCLVLDSEGKTVSNALPDIKEYYMRIIEMSMYASDFIQDSCMYELGLHKKIEKFFKTVHPDKLKAEFKNTNKECARMPGEKIYFYQNLTHALFQSEEFFSGITWVFGDVQLLSDMRGIIDKIYVCRVNGKFEDLVENCETGDCVFDPAEFETYGFVLGREYHSPVSQFSTRSSNLPFTR
jgi:hypothetical protein